VQYEGQVAWVTGGSSGIGRALAVELARRGADVAVSARRHDALEQTVAAIQATGRRGLAVPCDVTDHKAVLDAAQQVVHSLGAIDLAVANAGYGVSGPVDQVDIDHWRRQLDVNVLGVISTLQAALPHVVEREGRLVIIGSASAFAWFPRSGPYQVSKAALPPLAHTLAAELEGTGATVTLLHPGFVDSDIARVDTTACCTPSARTSARTSSCGPPSAPPGTWPSSSIAARWSAPLPGTAGWLRCWACTCRAWCAAWPDYSANMRSC